MKSRAEKDTVPAVAKLQLNVVPRGVLVALICLELIMTGSAAPANAQVGTPEAVACDLEPRPINYLVDLLDQPVPESSPEPLSGLPSGSVDVDPVTRNQVTSVVQKLIACVNAGEWLRAFSLYEEGYLRRLIDPEGLMPASVARELSTSFATPTALDESEATTLEAVVLVRRLSDDRVAIVVRTLAGSDVDGERSQLDLFVLSSIDGEWLIVDGLANLDPNELPAN